MVTHDERCWWEVALEQGMGSAYVFLSLFSISACRLALALWYWLVVGAPGGSLGKKLETFPGTGIEGYGSRHTVPTCLERCAPDLRRGSWEIVLFQAFSSALCPCVSWHRDRKGILSA